MTTPRSTNSVANRIADALAGVDRKPQIVVRLATTGNRGVGYQWECETCGVTHGTRHLTRPAAAKCARKNHDCGYGDDPCECPRAEPIA